MASASPRTLCLNREKDFDNALQEFIFHVGPGPNPLANVQVLKMDGGRDSAQHHGREIGPAGWILDVPKILPAVVCNIRRLSLANIDWSAETEEPMVLFLPFRHFTGLVELSVHHCRFRSFHQVQEFICAFPPFTGLCWNESGWLDESQSVYAGHLVNAKPEFTRIWLRLGNNLNLARMCEWLRITPTTQKLVYLNVNSLTFGSVPTEFIQAATLLQHLTLFVHLSFGGDLRDNNTISRCLTGHPDLHVFVFKTRGLSLAYDVEAILQQIPPDCRLGDLRLTMQIGDPENLNWVRIREILSREQFSKLEVLSLTFTAFDNFWTSFRLEDPSLRQMVEQIVFRLADSKRIDVEVVFEERPQELLLALEPNVIVQHPQTFVVTIEEGQPPSTVYNGVVRQAENSFPLWDPYGLGVGNLLF
ncbi:hypothetical protein B0H21DRAFT_826695 [Amylocystis lapponica]|nr:hypothetical protein B0H21DRAFT_826695 [Amylocystis lapponica]